MIFFHLLPTQPCLRWAVLSWLFLALTFYSELYYFLHGSILALMPGGRQSARQLLYPRPPGALFEQASLRA